MLAVAGGRWRREARLPEPPDGIVIPGPFTPPPTAAVPDEPPFTALETVVTTLPPQRLPEPETVVTPRRGRAKWITGGAALAACAGVGALALLAPGHRAPAPVPTPPPQRTATPVPARTLKAGPLAVTVPGAWPALSSPPAVPGLTHAVAAGSQADGIVLAGMVPHSAANPQLLPAALLKTLPRTPKPATVSLGKLAAFAYPRLRPALTVYSVPTSKGVAVVACLGADDNQCRTVAQSLKIEGAKVLPVAPDRALQRSINDAIRGLGGGGFRSASTRAAQGAAADRLAAAYDRAQRALAKLSPGPREQGALADLGHQLDVTRNAYRDLASAARAGDEKRYNAAAQRARGARRAGGAAGAGRRRLPHRGVHARRDPGSAPRAGLGQAERSRGQAERSCGDAGPGEPGPDPVSGAQAAPVRPRPAPQPDADPEGSGHRRWRLLGVLSARWRLTGRSGRATAGPTSTSARS